MDVPSDVYPRKKEKESKVDKALIKSFQCPILQELMLDPVVAADGYSYERAAIVRWIETRGARALSPMTGEQLSHLELTPNVTLRTVIGHYKETLPRRRELELTEQTLNLAITLHEEELSSILAKQGRQLSHVIEEKAAVEKKLNPLAQENQQLRLEIERLRQSKNITSDKVLADHLSEINSLSLRLSELNEAHSANIIKRFLFTRISRKKLNQTRLVQQEENSLHGLEILQQEYQQKQTALQHQFQESLQELESRLKSNLGEIGQKIAQYSGDEGDDEALERLATERRRLRESHTSTKEQLVVAHGVEQTREEQKQALKIQEQKARLQQIRGSKASKQRELCRWTDYTKRYTEVIEDQRRQLSEVSVNRSSRAEQLAVYPKETEKDPSKLMIARRQREERLLVPSTPNARVNQKAQSVSGRVKQEEITELLNYTIRGQLDEVRGCLNRNRDLVHAQGDVTDLSNRTFPTITAFQYAMWALDKEMWELILKYLPETDAYDQLMALEQERLDITQVHGTRLNFALLLEAYQKYLDNYDAWDWGQREACWCKEVGGAQRQMPAWFVYVFCEEGEDKAWPKEDFKKSFTRDPKHLSWWFDGEEYGGKLGVKWSPWRGAAGGRLCLLVGRAGRGGQAWNWVALVDRQHLSSCQKKRTSCRDWLKHYLKHAVETKNPTATLNNSRK